MPVSYVTNVIKVRIGIQHVIESKFSIENEELLSIKVHVVLQTSLEYKTKVDKYSIFFRKVC